MRYCYEALVQRDGDGWSVSFPQLGDYMTSGDTREQAISEAADLLKLLLCGLLEDGHVPPAAEHMVECVSVSVDVSPVDMARSHFMTQREAADLLGVSQSRVSALIRDGRLEMARFDGRTLVSIDSVNAYLESPRRAGRPPRHQEDSIAL